MPRPAGQAGISAGRECRASGPGGRRRGGTVVRTRLGGRTARTSRHTRFRAGIHRGGRDGAVHRRLAVGESRNARFLVGAAEAAPRSEEHTSELQSLMRISYAVFCLKKKKTLQKYLSTIV